MKFFTVLSFLQNKTSSLFDDQQGKTMAEYKQELLVKMTRKQFEKLQDLGLSIPVQLA